MKKKFVPIWVQYLLALFVSLLAILGLYFMSKLEMIEPFRLAHESLFLGLAGLIVLLVFAGSLVIFSYLWSSTETPVVTPWAPAPPPPPPPFPWWFWIKWVVVVIAGLLFYEYLDIPSIYLPHVATVVALIAGIWRRRSLVDHHLMAVGVILLTMLLGSLLFPQYLSGYVILTGVVPLVFALLLLWSGPVTNGDRMIELIALAYAVFMIVFFLMSLTQAPRGEAIILGIIFALIMLASIPEVRQRYFRTLGPRTPLNKTSVWIISIFTILLIVGVVISYHGTGWLGVARFVFTSLGLFFVLLAVIAMKGLNTWVKILIGIVIIATLFWRTVISFWHWLKQTFISVVYTGHEAVTSSWWGYLAVLICFFIVGWSLATYWRLWKPIGVVVFGLIFFWLFGVPAFVNGSIGQSTGTPGSRITLPISTGSSVKKLDPGMGQDSTTIKVFPDTALRRR